MVMNIVAFLLLVSYGYKVNSEWHFISEAIALVQIGIQIITRGVGCGAVGGSGGASNEYPQHACFNEEIRKIVTLFGRNI